MSGTAPPFQSKHSGSFYRSFLHAMNGLLHTVQHQRNMRLHIISSLLVAQVGAGVPLSLEVKVALLFCVMLVLFAEMHNSALEQLVDLATTEIDVRAKLTKDMAAAAVLVLAAGTITIFAAILVHDADVIFRDPHAIERQVLFGAPLTFFGGALMHESKRPAMLDVFFALAALALWAVTVTWTESYVFSAMALGMLSVTAMVAVRRRREAAAPVSG